jgi:FkbM family methyltransferase
VEKVKKVIKKLLYRHFLVDKKVYRNVKYLGSEYGGFYLNLELDDYPIIFDVGIGEDMSFSAAILKARPNGKIFAIDPTERSFEWFKKSGFYENKNVKFIRKALASTSGTHNFYSPRNDEHVSHSLETNKNVRFESNILFETVRLEDLRKILNVTHIDVLKIDIEGSEYAVLQNLSRNFSLPKQICVEFHDRFYKILTPRSRKTHKHLKSIGYELIGISDSCQEITYKLK